MHHVTRINIITLLYGKYHGIYNTRAKKYHFHMVIPYKVWYENGIEWLWYHLYYIRALVSGSLAHWTSDSVVKSIYLGWIGASTHPAK
jgi:hypothetical protein